MGRHILAAACLAALLGASGTGSTGQVELREQLAILKEELKALKAYVDTSNFERKSLPGRIDGFGGDNVKTVAGRRLSGWATASQHAELSMAADHMWLLLCGALVMFMQAGFAMLVSGSVRAKNVQNVLMKNLSDVCIGTVCWYVLGWTIAYGKTEDNNCQNDNFAGNLQYFGHEFFEAGEDGTQTPSNGPRDWFFQWAFCSASATIVSGAVAERMNFHAYAVYTVFMTSIIYPVVVSWTWGYGWLAGCANKVNDVGFFDFAGSGIVHVTGGVAALVAAIVVGPRVGRFDPNVSEDTFQAHSQPLVVLGTFILWFGWYGFNCGSTLAMSSADMGYLAAMVAMNTTLAAATCGLAVLAIALAVSRTYEVGMMCNGILAGLVSITAPCANVECGSAVAIGLIGACVYYGASTLLKKLKVDDPVDAFAVHGACGAWGVLAAALFDWGKGFDFFNGYSYFACTPDADAAGRCMEGAWAKAFAANVLEVLCIALWSGAITAIILVPLKVSGILRSSDEIQEVGLDAAKHSPKRAYAAAEERNPEAKHSPRKSYEGEAEEKRPEESQPEADQSEDYDAVV